MSVREFLDWERFAGSEPFLSERVDIAGAVVSATVANVNRGKSQKAHSISDFMVVQNANREESVANDDAREDAHLLNTMISFGGFG